MLGVAQLFPWNIFITASNWMTLVFPGFNFVFWMALPFNFTNIATCAFLTVYGNRISTRAKLFVAFFAQFALIVLLPMVNLRPWSLVGQVVISLLICACCGITTATLVGTGFGVVASLPPMYTTALMGGQGVAGLVAGVIQLILEGIYGDTQHPVFIQEQGIIYFGLCATTNLICTACTALLLNKPFFLYYQNRTQNVQVVGENDIKRQLTSESLESLIPKDEISVVEVFKKIWLDALNVVLVFFCTLCLFPGVDAILVPAYSTYNGLSLVTILILIFQVGDLCGRMLPQFWVPVALKNHLVFLILLRFAYFPLTLMIAIGGVRHDLFPALHHDWISLASMVLFAVTNGFFSTLSMMWGPSRVSEREQQVAGTMMTFFLQGGIFAGVSTAIGLLAFVNSFKQ